MAQDEYAEMSNDAKTKEANMGLARFMAPQSCQGSSDNVDWVKNVKAAPHRSMKEGKA